MTISKKTLKINEKVNENGLVEALPDETVADAAGGISVSAEGYEYDKADGIGYFKYSIDYAGETEKKAVAAVLNRLRPGGGDVLPRGRWFWGTIGIGNYYDGKYHDSKIISGEVPVENVRLTSPKCGR